MFNIYVELSKCKDVFNFEDDTLIAEAEDSEGLVLLIVKDIEEIGKRFCFDIFAKEKKHGVSERLITVEEGICDLELEKCTVECVKDYMNGLLEGVYKLCS